MGVRVLHFSDAHIDMIQGGRRDPQSGFSYRTLDFLKALDSIVDTAISEKVDLVLFAGDAYRDATPVPTYQREWGKRMMRLSDARIPTLMIAGNHDTSIAGGKASALQEYGTLRIPYLHLARVPKIWTPEELHGVPVQVLTFPWISRSRMVARDQTIQTGEESGTSPIFSLEEQIISKMDELLSQADPTLPLILMAHYSVQGAVFSSDQVVMLGKEVTLPLSLVKDPRIAYTALGHIHKFQDLNEGQKPPVIYPGSIERVNYGESEETKGFILADIACEGTSYRFVPLATRPMYNIKVTITSEEQFQNEVMAALPPAEDITDAMISLQVSYPEAWEYAFDERKLRSEVAGAFDFKLVKNRQMKSRIRLNLDSGISSMTHQDLLEAYLLSKSTEESEIAALQAAAQTIFSEAEGISPQES